MPLLNCPMGIADAIDKKEFTVENFYRFIEGPPWYFEPWNIVKKLAHYGIRGVANHWFRAYLCDRCQFVIYNNVLSAEPKILYRCAPRFKYSGATFDFVVH